MIHRSQGSNGSWQAEQLLLDCARHRVESTLLDDWKKACDLLFQSLWRDLGYLGVDMNSLRGFYSDSLKMSSHARETSLLVV